MQSISCWYLLCCFYVKEKKFLVLLREQSYCKLVISCTSHNVFLMTNLLSFGLFHILEFY